jgi:hypothetical protein
MCLRTCISDFREGVHCFFVRVPFDSIFVAVTPLESASGSCDEISMNLRSPWYNSIQWSTTALTPVQVAIARSNHNDDSAKIEMTGTKGGCAGRRGRPDEGVSVIGYRGAVLAYRKIFRDEGSRNSFSWLFTRSRVCARVVCVRVCTCASASSLLYVCMRVRIRVHEMETFVDGDTVGCLHDELWYFVPNVHSFRPDNEQDRERYICARRGSFILISAEVTQSIRVTRSKWSRGAPRNLFICHQRNLGKKDTPIPTNRGESVHARPDGNPTSVSLFSSQGVHSVIRGVSRCSRISPILALRIARLCTRVRGSIPKLPDARSDPRVFTSADPGESEYP